MDLNQDKRSSSPKSSPKALSPGVRRPPKRLVSATGMTSLIAELQDDMSSSSEDLSEEDRFLNSFHRSAIEQKAKAVAKAAEKPKPAPPPDPPADTYRALAAYDPKGAPNLLPLAKGDLVVIESQRPDGWWLTTIAAKKGFVPSSYLEKVAAVPVKKAATPKVTPRLTDPADSTRHDQG